MSEPTAPFWKTKTLSQMTHDEWESLCDGCGRCCLHKLRFEETNDLAYTNVACRLLNLGTARCGDYANRRRRVPDCVSLTQESVNEIDWLPPSCAYRRLSEGKAAFSKPLPAVSFVVIAGEVRTELLSRFLVQPRFHRFVGQSEPGEHVIRILGDHRAKGVELGVRGR